MNVFIYSKLFIYSLFLWCQFDIVKFDDTAADEIETQIFNNFDEDAVTKALDGFLIALSTDGDVTYVSENIHEYIGIQQVCNLKYNIIQSK